MVATGEVEEESAALGRDCFRWADTEGAAVEEDLIFDGGSGMKDGGMFLHVQGLDGVWMMCLSPRLRPEDPPRP